MKGEGAAAAVLAVVVLFTLYRSFYLLSLRMILIWYIMPPPGIIYSYTRYFEVSKYQYHSIIVSSWCYIVWCQAFAHSYIELAQVPYVLFL